MLGRQHYIQRRGTQRCNVLAPHKLNAQVLTAPRAQKRRAVSQLAQQRASPPTAAEKYSTSSTSSITPPKHGKRLIALKRRICENEQRLHGVLCCEDTGGRLLQELDHPCQLIIALSLLYRPTPIDKTYLRTPVAWIYHGNRLKILTFRVQKHGKLRLTFKRGFHARLKNVLPLASLLPCGVNCSTLLCTGSAHAAVAFGPR
jgi:hypothetical protein